MALEREDLIEGLREIVAELRAHGEQAGIRIVGGAALSLRYFDRASTVDIDAAIHPSDAVLRIAREIARRRGWPDNWVNTNATMFIPPMRDAWQQIFDGDGISISVGSPEMLLAMKLNASRLGRDDSDIARLLVICSIDSADEAEQLFETFYPGEVLKDKALRLLEVIFAKGLPTRVNSPPTARFE